MLTDDRCWEDSDYFERNTTTTSSAVPSPEPEDDPGGPSSAAGTDNNMADDEADEDDSTSHPQPVPIVVAVASTGPSTLSAEQQNQQIQMNEREPVGASMVAEVCEETPKKTSTALSQHQNPQQSSVLVDASASAGGVTNATTSKPVGYCLKCHSSRRQPAAGLSANLTVTVRIQKKDSL